MAGGGWGSVRQRAHLEGRIQRCAGVCDAYANRRKKKGSRSHPQKVMSHESWVGFGSVRARPLRVARRSSARCAPAWSSRLSRLIGGESRTALARVAQTALSVTPRRGRARRRAARRAAARSARCNARR
eukprot:6174431-Pleurochrysis_carterae.AAC.2